MDLAAPVRLVGGMPQAVDETGEGDERELWRKDEPNPQIGRHGPIHPGNGLRVESLAGDVIHV
jgi:hypothetical protein